MTDHSHAAADRHARVFNAISRTLLDIGPFVPLSVREQCTEAVLGALNAGDLPTNGRPTPHLDAVKAERDQLAATVQRVEKFADDLALYCSPHGLATQYAQQLREVLREPIDVQRMLDDATKAFADAANGAERVEVIAGMLTAWYAAWPATAVTDPNDGIAHQIVALVYAAEARAVACPCLPGAPKHHHGIGGYSTDPKPARTIAAGRPFRWDPADNCYCGGPGQTHPHQRGIDRHCRHTAEQEG